MRYLLPFMLLGLACGSVTVYAAGVSSPMPVAGAISVPSAPVTLQSMMQNSLDPAGIALRNRIDSLMAKAQTEGGVRVIVQLQQNFVPEGGLASASALNQRSQIASAQALVLKSLSGGGLIANPASVKSFQMIPFMSMRLTAAGLQAITQTPGVIGIEEDRLARPTLNNSVPLIGGQTTFLNGVKGNGETVAVLDTGVDASHPFFQGRVVAEACYSTTDTVNGVSSLCPGGVSSSTTAGSGVNCSTAISGCDHGTHAAGIVAGYQTDTFHGVAPGANIIAEQVFSKFSNASSCGTNPAPCILTYTSDQISALEHVYALRTIYKIAAVNMSLGGGSYTTQSQCDTDNQAIKAIIDNLRSVGIATVVASGNGSYTDALTEPACISSAISVGSTNDGYGNSSGSFPLDQVSYFSNGASFLSLLAPGYLINSSVPGGGFAYMAGTSMAAPHVAGAFAVLRQVAAPSVSVSDLLSLLQTTGVPVLDARNGLTFSRIDISKAVSQLQSTGGLVPPPLATTDDLEKLYVAGFLRAPELGGLNYWLGVIQQQGLTADQLATTIFSLAEVKAIYPADDAGFITAIYQNLFGHLPDPTGLNYWLGRLATGISRGSLVLEMVRAVDGLPATTPGKSVYVNRLQVSQQAVNLQQSLGKQLLPSDLVVVNK
jgi:subtilisin